MRLDLDGLANAAREALMSEWREVVGRPPPKHLSKPLMGQILSHTYQLETLGGYTKRLDSRLKSAARRDVVRPAFKPGQSVSDIMQAHNIPEGMIWKRIRLAFLSPKILRAIVDGTSNKDLTIKMLTQHDLPLDWSEQQALFLS